MQSDHGTLDPVKEGTRNSFREKRGQKSGKCERPCLIRQWPLSRLCRAKLFLNWYYWLFLVWPTSDCHADKRDILPDLCIDKSVSLCPVWFYSCCLSIHVSFSRRDTRFCVATFRGFRGLEFMFHDFMLPMFYDCLVSSKYFHSIIIYIILLDTENTNILTMRK